MCGIIGYIGDKKALPVLMDGLKALEYRGYDSAGVAVVGGGKAQLGKSAGPVANLEKSVLNKKFDGSLGIAHTRWATHGKPTEMNAHPHGDCTGRVFVVHNGIIENHKELKQYLIEKGHQFKSDTDTEVIAHLIEDYLSGGADFKTALVDAIKTLGGAYALAVVDAKNPNTLYAARFSSPLVIGLGKNETFLASDPTALVKRTKEIVYINDGEVAEITKQGIIITDLDKQSMPYKIDQLDWNLEEAQKGNYDHFMMKEIFEGPEVVRAAYLGRLKAKEEIIKLGGLEQVGSQLANAKRLMIIACGTSYYAGLVGQYIFEEVAGMPTEVHIASELRYRETPFEDDTVVLVISQSGETADTLAALRKTKEAGLLTLGLVNVVGSSISRETDAGVYNHAGPEIGVASTKAFLSQLTILYLMAFHFATQKGREVKKEWLTELENIPEKIGQILDKTTEIEKLAEHYKDYDNFFYIGRRLNFPVALEGALKLKEISYIHAEGYGAGEMKHGPIAMIDENFPTVAIAPANSVLEKMHSNIEEIKARGGPVLAIATKGDKPAGQLADDVFYIPKTLELFEPLLTVVPLQLLAYYIGVKRQGNVDKPRNLAKSVTVE